MPISAWGGKGAVWRYSQQPCLWSCKGCLCALAGFVSGVCAHEHSDEGHTAARGAVGDGCADGLLEHPQQSARGCWGRQVCARCRLASDALRPSLLFLAETRCGVVRPGCGLQQDRPLLLHEGPGCLLPCQRPGVVRRLAPRSPPVGLFLPPQVSALTLALLGDPVASTRAAGLCTGTSRTSSAGAGRDRLWWMRCTSSGGVGVVVLQILFLVHFTLK